MPLLALLTLVIQLSFCYHVLKTRRPYWWVFLIMSLPVAGCLIYYFVEIFPGSREERTAHKTARKLVKKLRPDAELKKRAEELEICGSVDNKIALAQECMDHQMYPEAASLYASCLQGPYASDGGLLFGLAKAATEGGNWVKAAETVTTLKRDLPSFRPYEVRLLDARVLEGQGNNDQALVAYRDLIPVFVGLEARYRYGELLAKLGQHEAANIMFNEVIKRARRNGVSLDEEQEWASGARRAISGSS
jgi:hypothetical protein